ncbi:hypothetical protein EVG20_g10048 [Dentipellis fragilis]|uniref:Uncharacterized protein n=1 Tax=Dentipellis fragilis TaxID=205917 RepID=A0A4Y9XTY7_9AGAM|nr:hypothetical protein EVG20_g10048 [Dentipellis fragilis]
MPVFQLYPPPSECWDRQKWLVWDLKRPGTSMVVPTETCLPALQTGLSVGEFSNINVPSRTSTPILSGRRVDSRVPQSEISHIALDPAAAPGQLFTLRAKVHGKSKGETYSLAIDTGEYLYLSIHTRIIRHVRTPNFESNRWAPLLIISSWLYGAGYCELVQIPGSTQGQYSPRPAAQEAGGIIDHRALVMGWDENDYTKLPSTGTSWMKYVDGSGPVTLPCDNQVLISIYTHKYEDEMPLFSQSFVLQRANVAVAIPRSTMLRQYDSVIGLALPP